jgi:hypothetical protein
MVPAARPAPEGVVMADKKLWISFAVAFVIVFLGGGAVHAGWLAADYAALPAIMRSEQDAQGYMGFMILAHLSIGMALAWTYRQGRKEGGWVGQGLRFGLAIALVSAVPYFMIYHAVAQFPFELMVKQCIGDTVTLLVAGLGVAFVDR